MKLYAGKYGKPGSFVLAAAGDSTKPRRFKIEAYDGGPLPVSGFDLPVIVDLATLEFPDSIPILIDHTADVEHTLGSTDSIVNNGQTLVEEGVVTATSNTALGVVTQADSGQRWQASIGVRVGDLQEIAAGQVIVVNKQSFRGPLLVARNSQMFETSVLPAGADWTTTVNLAARAARLLKGSATMPTFEEWLASIGVDPAKLDDTSRTAMTLAYDAMQNPAPTPPVAPAAAVVPAAAPVPTEESKPTVSAAALQQMQATMQSELLAKMRETQAAELDRQQKLAAVTAGHPQILATAIREGWEPMRAENAVFHEERKGTAPSGRRSPVAMTQQVLEAAVCMARQVPGHEKMYNDQTLQAAHTQFGRAGIGLQRLLLIAASEGGYSGGPHEGVRVSNLRPILKAAFSTLSLPGLLSNVANKELLAGYEADESLMLWKEIASVKSVSDFKTVTSYRMLDSLAYEQLGPGGKIKHGSLGEESYTRQANTYAKMFSLTRQDIINDDLGAFDDLRKRLGMGAAQKLSDVAWLEFLDNSTFFTAARGNYITGATTTLLTDFVGLELGVNAFRDLTTPTADGSKRIGGTPTILLVPPELGMAAERLYAAVNIGGGTTVANSNIHAGKYKPIIVPWLSDTSFTNYSATAWYLLRDPARYAAMTVSFLDGVEQPTVESADANFDTLGVEFRGYHDFGCDKAEYLAGIMSKGAA